MSSSGPFSVPSSPLVRHPTTALPLSDKTPTFVINAANKTYKHQYANIYFARLRILREFVQNEAQKRWKDVAGSPKLVHRVLDVIKGQLCFVIGTVYLDMPLKPNVLEDIGRDRSIPAPPPREKIYSPDDIVTLEDESGRIQLVGDRLKKAQLLTGVIAGALGLETSSGEFEVIDLCFAEMPPQHEGEGIEQDEMDIDEKLSAVSQSPEDFVAFVSGLDIGSPTPSDAQIQMLVEYLTGESGGQGDQISASQITRLVILGNSLAPIGATGPADDGEKETEKRPRRYGYDSASFSPHPILHLSSHLHDLASSMPVHLLPGASDPSGTILPQQSFPRAMFGAASTYATFTCETNPTYIHLASGAQDSLEDLKKAGQPLPRSRLILATSGQPLNDMFKYLPSPPATRLSIAESTLRWRHVAPTAPDTLWCHPYFTTDPFILTETPDIYAIGCQPRFSTRLVKQNSRKCRIILVPGFAETGVLVLVSLKTLDTRIFKFSVEGMNLGISSESQ